MKISALNISLSSLAFGLVFMAHSEPATFASGAVTGNNQYEPGRGVIERLGPQNDVEEELAQLEQRVDSKDNLTIEEYQEIQGQLDELLQRVNNQAKASGQPNVQLFGEVLELQQTITGIDVR